MIQLSKLWIHLKQTFNSYKTRDINKIFTHFSIIIQILKFILKSDLKLIDILLMFVSFLVVVNAQNQDSDFCNQFIKNNGIDYGYQHQTVGYYLFIDSYYWRLDIDYTSKAIQFVSLRSLRNNSLFDKKYEFAISANICLNKKCYPSKRTWLIGLYYVSKHNSFADKNLH